jgi:hypothetical protein
MDGLQESVLRELWSLLELESLADLKPGLGLFGAHPLRRVFHAHGLRGQGKFLAESVVRDLKACNDVQGIAHLREALKSSATFWSTRLQLALGGVLIRAGQRFEFEKPVDRQRTIIPASEYAAMRQNCEIGTAVDIHLLDLSFDIEIYGRSRQFFETFDIENFRANASVPRFLKAPVVCEAVVKSLWPAASGATDELEGYLLRSIPVALEGGKITPFEGNNGDISAAVRQGRVDLDKGWDYYDDVGVHYEGLECDAQSIHLCYRDETPLARFCSDLTEGLKKGRQLNKYPQGRFQILIIELPHTLFRLAEPNSAEFDGHVRKRVQAWLAQRRQLRLPQTVAGIMLAEFGSVADSSGAPRQILYRVPIAIDDFPGSLELMETLARGEV